MAVAERAGAPALEAYPLDAELTPSTSGTGKTSSHSDTYHGRFVRLVPNEQVVEVMELETADEAMRGEMTVTFTLSGADGGTDILTLGIALPSSAAQRSAWLPPEHDVTQSDGV